MKRKEIAEALFAVGIEEADREALLLFCHFANKTAAAAMADPQADCPSPALADALARRVRREPLAYILGEWAFYGECYRVTPACLIPRPETEMLVEYALTSLPHNGIFADFCTGSGCIAISTLVHRPDARAHAFDISGAALAVAGENAVRCGVADRLHLFEQDLRDTKKLTKGGGVCSEMPEGGYDLILSNPPYVRRGDMAAFAPELGFEPAAAFDGGEGGEEFYECFLADYRRLLAPGGKFVFEIGADQGDLLRDLSCRYGYECRIERDLAGRDRMAICTPLTQIEG